MEFTYVDGGVAFVVLVSAIMAYSRGFTREVLAIAGWLIAAAVAAFLTPMVEPLIREIPGVGPFLASSCVISVIVAFTLVMALALLVMAVFTPVFSSWVLDSALGPLDRVLGFVFGVARGALLVVVAYMVYGALVGDPLQVEPIANAESLEITQDLATQLEAALPTEMPPWLAERVDALMAPCAGEGLQTGEEGFPENPDAGGN
jgi:membrane protein required for colicin V production